MGNERIIIYTKTACNMFRKFEANFTKSTIGIKKKKKDGFQFCSSTGRFVEKIQSISYSGNIANLWHIHWPIIKL